MAPRNGVQTRRSFNHAGPPCLRFGRMPHLTSWTVLIASHGLLPSIGPRGPELSYVCGKWAPHHTQHVKTSPAFEATEDPSTFTNTFPKTFLDCSIIDWSAKVSQLKVIFILHQVLVSIHLFRYSLYEKTKNNDKVFNFLFQLFSQLIWL